MPEQPAYAIVGRGRWAARMHALLQKEGRRVAHVPEARRQPFESAEAYSSRLTSSLAATGATIAWLCVPPGPHLIRIIEAALNAGLHVLAEKPWSAPVDKTRSILNFAEREGLVVGVHFEYCLLDEIEEWRARFQGTELVFNGRFHTGRPNLLGLPALDNLGCHLLAIRRYAVPGARIGELSCGYAGPNQRRVWVDEPNGKRATVDFTENSQPLIQRFLRRFEAATCGAGHAFNLEFALGVAEDLAKVPPQGTRA